MKLKCNLISNNDLIYFYLQTNKYLESILPLVTFDFISGKRSFITKTVFFSFQLHVPEMVTVTVISILATVAIEMPFNQVYRIYFGKSYKTIPFKMKMFTISRQ